MSEIFGFFLSPHGIVLFVILWGIKAAFGVWLAVHAIRLLPERLQQRPMGWLRMLTPKVSHGILLGRSNATTQTEADGPRILAKNSERNF